MNLPHQRHRFDLIHKNQRTFHRLERERQATARRLKRLDTILAQLRQQHILVAQTATLEN